MRSLLASSIWGQRTVSADQWKYRNLKRVMFPTIDFLFFVGGLFAAYYTVPAISEFFSNGVVDFFAYMLSFTAVISFIGMAFPRLWALEMAGRSLMLGLMVAYVGALTIFTVVGTGNRGFVILISAVSICPIIWRLTLLGSEWQERRIAEKTHCIKDRGA